ncbi:hypothetical protein Btru_018240, partial [Bulinus truncatus]
MDINECTQESLSMMAVQTIDKGVYRIGQSKRKRCNFQRNWKNPRNEISSAAQNRGEQTGNCEDGASFCLSHGHEADSSAGLGAESRPPRSSEIEEINPETGVFYYFCDHTKLWAKTKYHLPWYDEEQTYIDSISTYRPNHQPLVTILPWPSGYLSSPQMPCLNSETSFTFPPSLLGLTWSALVQRGRRHSGHSYSTLLSVLVVVVMYFLSGVKEVNACYKFPPGIRDPCEGQVCKFGAECMSSIDGKIARCQCPSDCPSYGDNVGSKPVCGNDGNDYANTCELRKAACLRLDDIRVKYYGKC